MSDRRTSGFALPRQRRLRSTREFRKILQGASLRVHGRHLVLLGLPNSLHHPRLGMVVSRQAAHRAVQRNRLKRLIRESFRFHQHQLPNADIIVLARKNTCETSSADIRTALAGQWRVIAEQAGHPLEPLRRGGQEDSAASD